MYYITLLLIIISLYGFSILTSFTSLFLSFEKAILMMKLYIVGDFYKLLLATLLITQIWKLTKKS